MTIRFLRAWNGYAEQAIATLAGAEETRLIGLGLATPALANPAKNIVVAAVLTSAEFAALLAANALDVNAWYEVDGIMKYYNGTAWVDVGGGSSRSMQSAALIVGTLQSGMSATLALQGDSTGVNTAITGNVDPDPDRWFLGLAKRIAAAMPGVHVMYKQWNAAAQDYLEWLTIQTGTLGERHLVFGGTNNRTRSQVNTQVGDFTGDIDFRIRLAPDDWTPASIQTFMARQSGVGFRGWKWDIQTNGNIVFTWYANPAVETLIALTATQASVAGVDGQAMWLRTTVDIDNGGGGYTATMYKSTDGITWTQLVQSVTAAGATAIGNPTGVNYEIGGRGATTEIFSGKIYEAQLRDGLLGKIMNFQGIEAWSSNFVGTLGGSPTLYIVNGSEAGKDIDYMSDATRFPRMVIPATPCLQYLSTGHNEQIPRGAVMLAKFDSWVTLFNARNPLGNIVIAMQNPETSITNEASFASHANARTREIGAWALRKGHDIVDNGAALGRTGNINLYMKDDGTATDVHPNALGYALMADEAFVPYRQII